MTRPAARHGETRGGRRFLVALCRIMVEIGQDCPKFHHDFKNDLSCGATRPGEAVPAHRIGIASNRDRVLGIQISILEKRLVSVSSTSGQVAEDDTPPAAGKVEFRSSTFTAEKS